MKLRRVGASAIAVGLASLVAACGSSAPAVHHPLTVPVPPVHHPRTLPAATVHHHRSMGPRPLRCDTNGRLTLNGGSVQHHVVLYADFWGNWQRERRLRSDIIKTLKGLKNSQWGNTLTQYCDSSDYIHDDIRLGGIWSDASGTLSDQNFTEDDEVARAVQINHWKTTADTQVLLLLPDGWTPDGKNCGTHGQTAAGVIYSESAGPDTSFSCSEPGDPDGGVINTITHEVAETAEDPDNSTGYSDPAGNEGADLCQNRRDVVDGNLHLAPIWSNRQRGCVMSNPGLT